MSFVNTTVLFVAVFCAVRPAIATDYAIRFDYGVDHPDASDGPELKAKMFNWFKWRSVGWKKGGLFQNTSGQEIKAVHIKVTHPRTAQNPTGDLLAIASDPEDGVFDTIYLKDDYTEVIFSSSKGAVANGQTLWNKVTKSTTGEITACRNNGEDICPLEGKLFSTPQEPSEGKWTKIKSPGNEAELWKPIAALPRRFRQIDVYGVSNDEKFVVFASRNRSWRLALRQIARFISMLKRLSRKELIVSRSKTGNLYFIGPALLGRSSRRRMESHGDQG